MDYYGKCAEIISSKLDIISYYSIIKDRLYWISDYEPPKNQLESFYFCVDNVNSNWFRLVTIII